MMPNQDDSLLSVEQQNRKRASPPTSEVQHLRAQIEQQQREIKNLQQKLNGPQSATNNFGYSHTPLQQLNAQLLLQQIAPLASPLQ